MGDQIQNSSRKEAPKKLLKPDNSKVVTEFKEI